jgi:(Z)-2-((N-methylformamido)methylene)-5-hydroxybutyrolactone dehydrogenase
MELGGKSPNIVFDDAEIDNAVKGVISGIFAATGQTCIAGSRLLVQRAIHDQFVDKLVAFAKHGKMGDPDDADTQVGPVTNPPQFKKILEYIDIAKGEGAKPVLGGAKATRRSAARAGSSSRRSSPASTTRMRIAQEEVFGPVLSVIPFATRKRRSRSATTSSTGWPPGSGRRTCGAPSRWPSGCRPARCGSTPTAR